MAAELGRAVQDAPVRSGREQARNDVALPDTRVAGVTHGAWVDWFKDVPWDLSVTLTFGAAPPLAATALRLTEAYFTEVERALPFAPPYLAVVEGDAASETRTHVHALIAGVAHLAAIRTIARDGFLRRPWPSGHVKVGEFHTRSLPYTTKRLPAGAPFLIAPGFWGRVHNVKRWTRLQKKWERRRLQDPASAGLRIKSGTGGA